ncbi:MAG: prolipoprotein diacylglyceryl transferase [Lachnospiraceae bacterium]|jgi:phosphatidylglycerol:prolipoprotein diacylglycerol transferase|nr:prolipoprotein diacylglyceryl transferase [Lachnospiraceae bacterium]
MKPDLFSIGSVTVHGYGLMIAIGVLAAVMAAEKRAPRLGLNGEHIFNIAVWGVAGGVIGAKVLYWIVELPDILADPSILLDIGHGFVIYGAILGGILGGFLYCRVKKLNFLAYFDLVMPSVALAQGFGRLGCLLAGCCYGKQTDSWFHIVFTESDLAPRGVPLIPTQIISSAANFLHFAVLLWIAKRVKGDGQVAGFYLIFYSVGRSLIELLRDDPRGAVGGLSTSQFISLFILAAGIGLVAVRGRRK